MFHYLLVAVILTVILTLIHRWISRDSRRRARARKSLDSSQGTFDIHARTALGELRDLDKPTPEDRQLRAEILRYNLFNGKPSRMAAREIANDYAAALRDRDNSRDKTWRENDGEEFLIHAAEEFYIDLENMGIVDIPLQTLADTARDARRERREMQAAGTASRIETVSQLLSPVYPADRQNVHDSKVNRDLAYILGKFRRDSDSGLSRDPAGEILEYTKGTRGDEPRVKQALDAIFSENSFMTALNASECEILSLVWARCSDSRNAHVLGEMRGAVVQALVDCVENGSVVCNNGRCARLVNAFVTIDFDPEVSTGAMTFAAYRNQVFSETEEILRRVVLECKAGSDEALRGAALAYDDPNASTGEAPAEPLRERIRAEVSQNLKKYETVFSEAEMTSISDECRFISEI